MRYFCSRNLKIEQLTFMYQRKFVIHLNFSRMFVFFELVLSVLNTNEHSFYNITTPPDQQQQHEKDNSEKNNIIISNEN